MYYLICLERTKDVRQLVFWKPNRKGYTLDIQEAGLYSQEETDEICNSYNSNTACLKKYIKKEVC